MIIDRSAYYSVDEVYNELGIDDVEDLLEYLNGISDAIELDHGNTYYKKEYVDKFLNIKG